MLSLPFYLLLTISIVSKCANAYVLDESVSMNNEDKSQTDEKQRALFDGTIRSSSRSIHSSNPIIATARNTNDADNQIRASTLNVTAIDNSIDMPKPNDATVDATSHQMSRESRNTLTEVETGRRKKYGSKLGGGGGKKKKYKWLYPVMIGLFITKMIVFPLFVKAVTIMSSAAFVFSKMSLLASLILGLKFFLTNNNQNNDSKVEIVHVPLKKYGGEWDRETSESKFHNVYADNIYEHELRPTRFVL